MLAALDLSAAQLLVCSLAAVGGAIVQGAVGFGYAFVMVPTLLLVAPATVPVAPLVVAFPMVLVLALADRRALDRRGFLRLTAGRIPGTVVGAWAITAIGASMLAAAAGGLLLAAVVASVARGARRTSPRFEVLAGFVSGIAGTVGAVGGPYLGLAYADRAGPVLRATISAAFAVGVVLSLIGVALAGALELRAVWVGIVLIPATFAGLWVGRRAAERLGRGWLRPLVHAFAATAGTLTLVRALL